MSRAVAPTDRGVLSTSCASMKNCLARAAACRTRSRIWSRRKTTLEQTIKELMDRLYGRRSERLKFSPDQLPLDFGDGEADRPVEPERAKSRWRKRQKRRRRGGSRRSGRADGFPSISNGRTERIEPELPEGVQPEDCGRSASTWWRSWSSIGPACGFAAWSIPSTRFPASRNSRSCKRPTGSLIPGGSFGFGIAAEVLFNKFALHVPLYRQQDPLAQLGWAPSRSTLCQIVVNSRRVAASVATARSGADPGLRCRQHGRYAGDAADAGRGEGSRTARFWIYRSRAPAPVRRVRLYRQSVACRARTNF